MTHSPWASSVGTPTWGHVFTCHYWCFWITSVFYPVISGHIQWVFHLCLRKSLWVKYDAKFLWSFCSLWLLQESLLLGCCVSNKWRAPSLSPGSHSEVSSSKIRNERLLSTFGSHVVTHCYWFLDTKGTSWYLESLINLGLQSFYKTTQHEPLGEGLGILHLPASLFSLPSPM